MPLLHFLEGLNSAKQARRWGALWGIGFCLSHYFWLSRFGDFSLWTLGGAALGYAGYGALYLVLLYFANNWQDRIRLWLIPMSMSVWELARSIGYLAFPWNLTAHSFHSVLILGQISAIGGSFLLGFLIQYLQTLVYLTVFSRKQGTRPQGGYRQSFSFFKREYFFGAILLAAALAFGAFSLAGSPEPDNYADLVLVQQNRDSWRMSPVAEVLGHLQDLSREHGPARNLSKVSFDDEPFSPSLYVWSETSIPISAELLARNAGSFPVQEPFGSFLTDIGVALLSGAALRDEDAPQASGLMNGAALFTLGPGNSVSVSDSYAKKRLVPFAEHVPIGDLPFLRDFLEQRIGISGDGWQFGPDTDPIKIPVRDFAILAGIPICFEDSFFQLTREMVRSGAQLFINLTNNSWSGTNTAQTQHFAAAKFRAIEDRRLLIRSTNSGVTSVIDPWGRVLYRGQSFQEEAVAIRVPLWLNYQPMTPYVLMGDWIPISFALLLLLCIGYRAFGVKKKPDSLETGPS